MIISRIGDAIRYKARATEESMPTDEILVLMNLKQYMFAGDLEYLDEGYEGDIQETDLMATGTGYSTNLDGDKIFTREYSFPENILSRMKFLDAKLDGEHWVRLVNKNLNMEKVAFEEANLLEKYSNEEGSAGFTYFRGGIFLLTGEIEEDVTKGMKLWLFKAPTLITDLSSSVELATFGIPYQLQESFIEGVVADWKSNHDKPLSSDDQSWYIKYQNTLAKLRNFNRDQEIIAEMPMDTTDDGFEN